MTVDSATSLDDLNVVDHYGYRVLIGSKADTVGDVDDLDAAKADIASLAGTIEHLQKMLKVTVVEACDNGLTEVEAAKLAQVSRMTIRSWRGK